jgi:hypothetical protein
MTAMFTLQETGIRESTAPAVTNSKTIEETLIEARAAAAEIDTFRTKNFYRTRTICNGTMIDFGFKIQADGQMNYDTNNRRILQFVRKTIGRLVRELQYLCLGLLCRYNDYSLRHLIILARRE